MTYKERLQQRRQQEKAGQEPDASKRQEGRAKIAQRHEELLRHISAENDGLLSVDVNEQTKTINLRPSGSRRYVSISAEPDEYLLVTWEGENAVARHSVKTLAEADDYILDFLEKVGAS
jgi:hypothetical protein